MISTEYHKGNFIINWVIHVINFLHFLVSQIFKIYRTILVFFAGYQNPNLFILFSSSISLWIRWVNASSSLQFFAHCDWVWKGLAAWFIPARASLVGNGGWWKSLLQVVQHSSTEKYWSAWVEKQTWKLLILAFSFNSIIPHFDSRLPWVLRVIHSVQKQAHFQTIRTIYDHYIFC